jgi:uroporphyrinogen-III synthase
LSRRVAILRPEPGNAATAERAVRAGLDPLALPLFEVRPLAWTAPAPEAFDGLLLTSANAIRHGGIGLSTLRTLPVLAVGTATASAARAYGFDVVRIGSTDATELLRDIPGSRRLLWLAGRERAELDHPAISDAVPVYASDALELSQADAERLAGNVALIHSTRAGSHFAAELARHGISRATIRIAAISARAAEAAGNGWAAIAIAGAPDDDALIAAARPLAIDP